MNELDIGTLARCVLDKHPAFSVNPLGDWEELVSEQVAKYCQPHALKKKILYLNVYDSVWKYHLELNKRILLERINKGRDKPVVESIRIRVGELSQEISEESENPAGGLSAGSNSRRRGKRSGPSILRKKKRSVRQLTSEEKAFLKTISDPDIRKLGARLLQHIPLDTEK